MSAGNKKKSPDDFFQSRTSPGVFFIAMAQRFKRPRSEAATCGCVQAIN